MQPVGYSHTPPPRHPRPRAAAADAVHNLTQTRPDPTQPYQRHHRLASLKSAFSFFFVLPRWCACAMYVHMIHTIILQQIRARASGGRVLRRRRRRRGPSARQFRRGAGEHGGLPGVEARRDGRAGHAAPGADDRRRRGRRSDPDGAAAAVLGAVLPRRIWRVLLEVSGVRA